VTEAKQRAFEVHESTFEIAIDAPPSRVWRALVDETTSWWHDGFYAGRDPRGMRIEAQLGGRMWEDWGDGQGLVWGQVIGVRKDELLQVSGLIDASFGGPAGLITAFRLAPRGAGTTLSFKETSWGAANRSTRDSLESGWRFLLDDCLRLWIERGERCTKSPPG